MKKHLTRLTVLLCALCLIFSTMPAQVFAAGNGSVNYLICMNEDELDAYIDNNGEASSVDVVESHNYSNVYRLVLDQPGTLMIEALAKDSLDFYLYSDFNLLSEVTKTRTIESSKGRATSVYLDQGTYYYRIYGSYKEMKVAVFLGFTPDDYSTITNTTYFPVKTTEEQTLPTITPVIVPNADTLANLIDQGLPCAAKEELANGQSGRVYSISVTESGTLVFCVTRPQASLNECTTINVYSNASLTSRLLKNDTIASTKKLFPSFEVTPGTYYLQLNNWNGSNASHFIYVGLIPDSGIMPESYEIPEIILTRNEQEIQIPNISSIDTLESSIKDSEYLTLVNKDSYFTFTLPEAGYLYMSIQCNNLSSLNDAVLYSTATYSSLLSYIDGDSGIKDNYLDAGTYNLSVTPYNNSCSVALYMGFLPTSSVIRVSDITLNEDQTQATVNFDVADTYDPLQMRAMIRIEPAFHTARSIANQDVWQEKTRVNAIEGTTAILTHNGTYTARISGNGLDSHLVYFTIEGLNDESADQAPLIQPPVEFLDQPVVSAEETPAPTQSPEDLQNELNYLMQILEQAGIEY